MKKSEKIEDVGDDGDIGDIESRYKDLCRRRDSLKSDHGVVMAHLEARQAALKKLMDECRALGYDPENLPEKIRREKQVIKVKLDNLEADIEAGEKIIRPMLDTLRQG